MPKFSPEFLDELKTRLRPSDVVGRYIKLQKRGNAWWGLSPFNKEKTPSFTVNDERGTYHCFSSQNHGDIITFLIETQGMSFPEAVEALAADAGLTIPADSPAEAERAAKAKGLAEACSAAAQYFETRLRRNEGQGAMDYLLARGVTEADIREFRIGFAPDQRAGLRDALLNKGFSIETLVEAGLVIKPDDGAAYDRFRGRIMFPITGTRDRVIAFGGRALYPNARAKYLNSPETPLFHKSAVLYRLNEARAAAQKTQGPVIVCEGYMDVIALWRAGFHCAVAPLGTALTEDQLGLMWRSWDEPMLCFDGDKAGIAAAHRSVDRALPHLAPGKSLNFAFMPDGEDPDDVVRASGASGFQAILDKAQPLIEVLWDRETASRDLDTPERRAALRAHMRTLVKTIADRDVRAAYGNVLADRLENALAPPKRPQPSSRRAADRTGAQRRFAGRRGVNFMPAEMPTDDLKRRGGPAPWRREAAIMRAIISHPSLLERRESEILDLDIHDQALKSLLSAILNAFSRDPSLDSAGLKSHLTAIGAADSLERVLDDFLLSKQQFLRPDAEIDEVEHGFMNLLTHHLFESEIKREVANSASQFSDGKDDGWKSAVNTREELINSSRASEGDSSGDDAEEKRFNDSLRNWRSTGREKFGR